MKKGLMGSLAVALVWWVIPAMAEHTGPGRGEGVGAFHALRALSPVVSMTDTQLAAVEGTGGFDLDVLNGIVTYHTKQGRKHVVIIKRQTQGRKYVVIIKWQQQGRKHVVIITQHNVCAPCGGRIKQSNSVSIKQSNSVSISQ